MMLMLTSSTMNSQKKNVVIMCQMPVASHRNKCMIDQKMLLKKWPMARLMFLNQCTTDQKMLLKKRMNAKPVFVKKCSTARPIPWKK